MDLDQARVHVLSLRAASLVRITVGEVHPAFGHRRSTVTAMLDRLERRGHDADLLQRAVEVYEVHRLDFADAYLVAGVERTGIGVIASFDRTIDRVTTVRREEPG